MSELQDFKQKSLEWVDAHGVDTSRDILILLMGFTILTFLINNTSGFPTISAVTLYKTIAFGTLTAYIFYAAAKPKWE